MTAPIMAAQEAAAADNGIQAMPARRRRNLRQRMTASAHILALVLVMPEGLLAAASHTAQVAAAQELPAPTILPQVVQSAASASNIRSQEQPFTTQEVEAPGIMVTQDTAALQAAAVMDGMAGQTPRPTVQLILAAAAAAAAQEVPGSSS